MKNNESFRINLYTLQLQSDGKAPRRKIRAALIISCVVVLCVCALSIGLYFGLRENKTVVVSIVRVEWTYRQTYRDIQRQTDRQTDRDIQTDNCIIIPSVFKFTLILSCVYAFRKWDNGCSWKFFDNIEWHLSKATDLYLRGITVFQRFSLILPTNYF